VRGLRATRPAIATAEGQLREVNTVPVNETHFHWLADSLAQLIWVVDPGGRISFGNASWCALTAIGEGARFLDHYLPALHPDDRPLWERTWNEAISSAEPYALERRVRFTPHSRYVTQLEWGNPILENGIKTGEWIIIATDADENERRIAELCRSIERKDRFLGLVTHEMRGPLAPISSALQLVTRHMDDPSVVNHACETLSRQVTQLVRLVDDLFDLARSQNAQLLLTRASFELEAAVASAVEAAQPMIESRAQCLSIVRPPDPTIVDGDAGRLTQVFANLLINASKFTDAGGRICISVEREFDWVLVKVRDSGIGIPPEMLPRVFDAYVRAGRGAQDSRSGLGLGLALARHLTELHGGTVSVHSEGFGLGSEFVVRLPTTPVPERPAGNPAHVLPFL
jgi:signal transduction histidine kinase